MRTNALNILIWQKESSLQVGEMLSVKTKARLRKMGAKKEERGFIEKIIHSFIL